MKLTKENLVASIIDDLNAQGIGLKPENLTEIDSLKDIPAVIKYFGSRGVTVFMDTYLSPNEFVSELRTMKTNTVSELICTRTDGKFDFSDILSGLIQFGDLKPSTDL